MKQTPVINIMKIRILLTDVSYAKLHTFSKVDLQQ